LDSKSKNALVLSSMICCHNGF